MLEGPQQLLQLHFTFVKYSLCSSKLELHKEYFTNQHPKEDVSAVPPWTEPRGRCSWETHWEHAWNPFFISHWDNNIKKNYIHDTWPANKINFLFFPPFFSFFLSCFIFAGFAEVQLRSLEVRPCSPGCKYSSCAVRPPLLWTCATVDCG